MKGIAFREFVRWYERSRGRDALLKAWRSLPDDLRAQLDPDRDAFGLLAGSWYPIQIPAGLLESITWGLSPEARVALLREGTHHAVKATLTGVYRVLFETLMTPERHARYAQKIWSNYYNTGHVEGRILGPGRAEQVVRDWNGHHALLCELSIWSVTVFHEHMGCTNVKVSRSACVLSAAAPRSSRGVASRDVAPVEEGACRFLVTWDAAGRA